MVSTWSFSRDQALHTCERRYYFLYLIAARINSRDEFLREIAFLKKLSNVLMWKGKSYHALIAKYLRNVITGRPQGMKNVLGEHRIQMERQWRFSENCAYRSNLRSLSDDNNIALFEHEYEENAPDFDSIFRDIENWAYLFENWAVSSGLINELHKAVRYWLEPPTYGPAAVGFPLDGVQVITKVDLAFIRKDRQFDIYEWKTGKPPANANHSIYQAEFQVNIYQIWPYKVLNQSLDSIQANLVYINHGPETRTFLIDQNLLEYTLGIIRRSISRVKHFDNLIKQNDLSLSNLDYAPFSGACKQCSFKRICRRNLLDE